MMRTRNSEELQVSGKTMIAARQYVKERDYWLQRLSGQIIKSRIPYDHPGYLDSSPTQVVQSGLGEVHHVFPQPLYSQLKKMSRGVDHTLHIILLAVLDVLLHKYTGSADILTGAVIYKQDIAGPFINTVLALREQVAKENTFKKLLLQVRETIRQAVENYRCPIEILAEQLQLPVTADEFPLFDSALILQNIHDKAYLRHIRIEILFCFFDAGDKLEAAIEYDPAHYSRETILRLVSHFTYVLEQALEKPGIEIADLSLISPGEKRRLLVEFNETEKPYPADKTIRQLAEEQAARTPDHIALVGPSHEFQDRGQNRAAQLPVPGQDGGAFVLQRLHLSFMELNARANRLAWLLKEKEVGPDTIVGIMMHPSIEMIAGILAILKAGGAYLPINPAAPQQSILSMLEDSGAPALVAAENNIKSVSFRSLRGFEYIAGAPHLTSPRAQVEDLDSLQIPDRSLIDYEKYRPYIGQAMVKNSITIHMSRGCAYNCAFCFKIWPKKYIIRSAENIFNEINFYYKMGIRRFAFVDDLPNINVKVSSRVFQMIIDHGLKVHLHFPNGIRGDILTPGYIDLMVKAGAITMDLALETTSPRLQQLIRKNLNLEKLAENISYITQQHPQVILELQIIHGIPTETEEEALASLDFFKRTRWIHFPYIHILNIYPNSVMARIAQEHGISREAIERSADLAYHELPETLPFSKSFTRQFQSEFLNDYFLSRERLLTVLPHQMKVLTEDELVQKYNSYLPMGIKSFGGLLDLARISRSELPGDFLPPDYGAVPGFNQKLKENFPAKNPGKDALRILLLDLSQYFTHDTPIMYDVVEPPLGLLYLLTHLYRTYGARIDGRIAKSRIDFNSFSELKQLIDDFRPQVIGVRTLNFYRDFFHKTIALVKQWQPTTPIIAGGPYATSNYDFLLKDRAVDLLVIGEGEITLAEIIGRMLANGNKLPAKQLLADIPGIAFQAESAGREIFLIDEPQYELSSSPGSQQNPAPVNRPQDAAYIIYTSGSTGVPKGVMIRHDNLVNQLVGLRQRFGFAHDMNYLLLAAFTFDVSVMHIFLPLISGAKLNLIDEDTRKDPAKLWNFVHRENINILNIVPAYMKVLLEHIEKRKIHLKYLFVGGDVFPAQLHQGLNETFDVQHIINIYGPTETTINAVLYPCKELEPGGTIPIGKPVMNYRVYILDKEFEPQPIGVAGELCIAGPGVARGYLNNPETTAEKFKTEYRIQNTGDRIKNTKLTDYHSPLTIHHSPFTTHLYKSGDLARWLPDGNIEFLVRIDRQVKVRGFRIEPGEIENRLSRHRDVQEAVVTVNEDNNQEKYLCAYIVTRRPPVPADRPSRPALPPDLREYLTRTLPEYMIPAYFIPIEKIPLTINGKPDLKALPQPKSQTAAAAYTPPRNEIEQRLAALWAEVLAVDVQAIGIDSNFFELGGHSLKATILISRIHKQLAVNIPLVQLFRTPNIRGLSPFIAQQEAAPFAAIAKAPVRPHYILSPAQKRLFILQRMDPGNTSYNLPTLLSLAGVLDRDRIAAVFEKLLERQESLRTSFYMEEEVPVQKIHDPQAIDFQVEYYEALSFQPDELIGRFIRPFDLTQAPLFRVGFIKIEEAQHIFMFDMHHIISDGLSLGIMSREFMALYAGKELLPLKNQYKDYAEWLNSETQEESLLRQGKYWLGQFSDGVPVLNLPMDYPRPAIQDFAGRMLSFEVGPEATAALNKLAREHGATLYMVLLAIFNILLARLSGQEDIVVGTPTAGRRHAELQGIIGMFVNTLALRNFPCGEKAFNHFLGEVKASALAAFDNQEYPFENLLEKVEVNRDIGRNPLFDVMFALHNVEVAEVEIPGLKLSSYKYESRTAKFDLTLLATEVGEKLFFVVEYCTKLFKEETINKYIRYFQGIIASLIASPAGRLSEIGILADEERRQLLYDFNDITSGYPIDKTLFGLFSEQAAKTPRGTAVVFEGEELTYEELEQRADRLARALIAKGIKRPGLIGIMADRSLEMITGILGILKTGCGYVPLNPDAPPERSKYMLVECGVELLLTARGSIDLGIKTLFLEEIEELFIENRRSESFVRPSVSHDSAVDLAYVIFTSGSTGKPKGVPITHANLSQLLHWGYRNLAIDANDRTMQNLSYYFDWSVWEIFITITTGAALYIVPDEVLLNPSAYIDFIDAQQITILHITPTQYYYLAGLERKTETLKYLFIGAEKLSYDLLARSFNQVNEQCRVFNMYGPTEATIIAAVWEVDRQGYKNFSSLTSIPIGKAIGNTALFILNKHLELCPVNITGELCIAGDGLARGYLNNPELTAEKFKTEYRIQNTECRIKNTKLTDYHSPLTTHLYKTGDLARRLPDGSIECLGRLDYQLKIRGFRIEPGEIEDCLRRHGSVKEAVVIDGETGPGDKYLCAYIVPTSDTASQASDAAALREYLSQNLPDYMVPAYLVFIESIPLNPNGKLDRKALPNPQSGVSSAAVDYLPPRTPIEKSIAAVWQEVLGTERIGVHDRFFDIGGNSLNIIRIGIKLSLELGINVPVVVIFRFPTVGSLANYLEQQLKPQAGKPAAARHPDVGNRHARVSEAKDRRLQKINKKRNIKDDRTS